MKQHPLRMSTENTKMAEEDFLLHGLICVPQHRLETKKNALRAYGAFQLMDDGHVLVLHFHYRTKPRENALGHHPELAQKEFVFQDLDQVLIRRRVSAKRHISQDLPHVVHACLLLEILPQ